MPAGRHRKSLRLQARGTAAVKEELDADDIAAKSTSPNGKLLLDRLVSPTLLFYNAHVLPRYSHSHT